MQTSSSFSPGVSVPLSPPLNPPASAYTSLDDPHEWTVFGKPARHPADCWESSLLIEGMFCAACAVAVEDALRALPGVVSADVSAGSHRARVVWSPGQAKPSDLMRVVQQAGYLAVPANDMMARDRRQVSARKALWRWLVAGFCMMQVMMYAYPAYVAQPGDLSPEMAQLLRWASWVLTLPVMVFSCTPFFVSAWRGILHRRVSMDLPVALGMLITFVVSSAGTFDPGGLFGREVYFDSLTMFVFFLLTGRWLELRLRDQTAGALEALMNRLPDTVQRLDAAGDFERVAVRRLRVGDIIRVLPGESFAADGVVLQGNTLADESLLTGEATPVVCAVGDAVVAGSHNLSQVVQVRVDRVGAATRYGEIVSLMETAATTKPQLAHLADRVAKPFMAVVLLTAVFACAAWWPLDPGHAMMVAVAVLIVTCPCALSLAAPAAMLAAAGTLAKNAVLVRRLQALESLSGIDTLIFDKTGTLTDATMALGAIHTRVGVSPGQALALAVALAGHSLHPLSKALLAAGPKFGLEPGLATPLQATEVREVVGQGLQGNGVGVGVLRLGSMGFCGVQSGVSGDVHFEAPEGTHPGFFQDDRNGVAWDSQIFLSDGAGWLATFEVLQGLRPDACAAVAALQAGGIEVEMLSGDSQAAVDAVASQLGITHAKGGCLPQEKLSQMQGMQRRGLHVAMVGDGLNDGPVLAGAQVSFAFGQAVPLAQASADFVVLSANLMTVAQTVLLARQTMAVVRQNIWWAAVYNAACIPLAVLGYLPAWAAGLGMATSSLLVVLNALRLSTLMPRRVFQ